jgi:hypothetical protein
MQIIDSSQAIYIGNDWELRLWYCIPSSFRDILSSASGVITTKGEHGFSNGDRVRMGRHFNTSGVLSTLNGIGTVSNATSTTFKNGLSSNGTGNPSGVVAKVNDLTGSTVTAQIREYSGESAPLIVTPTLNTIDLDGEIILSLTDAQTALTAFTSRQRLTVTLEVKVRDTTDFDKTILQLPLKIYGRVIQ